MTINTTPNPIGGFLNERAQISFDVTGLATNYPTLASAAWKLQIRHPGSAVLVFDFAAHGSIQYLLSGAVATVVVQAPTSAFASIPPGLYAYDMGFVLPGADYEVVYWGPAQLNAGVTQAGVVGAPPAPTNSDDTWYGGVNAITSSDLPPLALSSAVAAAEAAATAAANSATAAAGSETQAQMEANAAAASAASASASATTATNQVTLATNAANAAAGSQSAAATSATSAGNQANASAASATGAAGSATAASGSATTASNQATASANSATQSANSATAAANSASAAAASAAIAVPGGSSGQLQYNNSGAFGGYGVGSGLAVVGGNLTATGGGGGIPVVASMTALVALPTSTGAAWLELGLRSGLFAWSPGDHSQDVANDPGQGEWAAPSSNTFVVSGTITPNLTGTYNAGGTFNGASYYALSGGGGYLYYQPSPSQWVLAPTLGATSGPGWVTPGVISSPTIGSYPTNGAGIGTANVATLAGVNGAWQRQWHDTCDWCWFRNGGAYTDGPGAIPDTTFVQIQYSWQTTSASGTDNGAAFSNWCTWARYKSTLGQGVYVEPSPGCYGWHIGSVTVGGGGGYYWFSGIRKLHVNGRKSVIMQNLDNGASSAACFPISINSGFQVSLSYLVNNTTPNQTLLTYVTGSQAALLTPGQWVLLASYDLQHSGYPMNCQYFQWLKVISVNVYAAITATGAVYTSSTGNLALTFPTPPFGVTWGTALNGQYVTISGSGVAGIDGTWPITSIANLSTASTSTNANTVPNATMSFTVATGLGVAAPAPVTATSNTAATSSTTPNNIVSSGSVTFAVPAGPVYPTGQVVTAASGANSMTGTVAAGSTSTSLIMNVASSVGSGAGLASWTITFPAISVSGAVVSYNSSTGALVVNATSSTGTAGASAASWSVMFADLVVNLAVTTGLGSPTITPPVLAQTGIVGFNETIKHYHRSDFPDYNQSGFPCGAARIWVKQPTDNPVGFDVDHTVEDIQVNLPPNNTPPGNYATITGRDMKTIGWKGPGFSETSCKYVVHKRAHIMVTGETDKLVEYIRYEDAYFDNYTAINLQSANPALMEVFGGKINGVIGCGQQLYIHGADINQLVLGCQYGQNYGNVIESCNIQNCGTGYSVMDGIPAYTMVIDGVNFSYANGIIACNLAALAPSEGLGYQPHVPGMMFVVEAYGTNGAALQFSGNVGLGIISSATQDANNIYFNTTLPYPTLNAAPWTNASNPNPKINFFHVGPVTFRNCKGADGGALAFSEATEAGRRSFEYWHRVFAGAQAPLTIYSLNGALVSVECNVWTPGSTPAATLTLSISSYNPTTFAPASTVVVFNIGVQGYRKIDVTGWTGKTTNDSVTVGGSAATTLTPGQICWIATGAFSTTPPAPALQNGPVFELTITMNCGAARKNVVGYLPLARG